MIIAWYDANGPCAAPESIHVPPPESDVGQPADLDSRPSNTYSDNNDWKCLQCGCVQKPSQAKWGVFTLVVPAWWTWQCCACDEPWSFLVQLSETGEYLFAPRQLPK